MTKKTYFQEPSIADMRKEYSPFTVKNPSNFAEAVLDLKDGQYLIIDADLMRQAPGKFFRHGKYVELRKPKSIEEAVEGNVYPSDLREDAFDSIKNPFHPGYSFRPFGEGQNDLRERRVRLVELLEGLRILSYGAQTGTDVEIIKAYQESKRTLKDGAVVSVSVPSRTQESDRYRFRMMSVVVDQHNPNKFSVANGFNSDISLPVRDWSFRFNYYCDKESSRVVNIFAPEIAAYFKFVMQEIRRPIPNRAPYEMSPFAVPSNLAVEYYKKLISRVAVKDRALKSRHQLRKLNKAEQEIMLWSLVMLERYEKTFSRKVSVDGEVKDLDWRLGQL